MYQKGRVAMVKVNKAEIPVSQLPYHHPTGLLCLPLEVIPVTQHSMSSGFGAFVSADIHIRRSGEGIALHAPEHGLQEVYFDVNFQRVVNSRFSAATTYRKVTLFTMFICLG